MIGWLIYDRIGAARNTWFAEQIIAYAQKRGVQIKLILCEELTVVCEEKIFFRYNNSVCETPDFVINRTIFPFLAKCFEQCGIAVFNNADVSEICNDKRKTHMHLSNKGVNMMESRFFDKRFFDFSTEIEYPCVVKPANGHGGKGVEIVSCAEELKKTIDSYETYAFLTQKIASDKGRDLRVYVMDNKIVGAVMRKSADDFRSNFSLGGSVGKYLLDSSEERVVENVIKNFELTYAGIDFVFDNGEMKLNEIEDVVGARMLYQTHDIAVHELFVDCILKKMTEKNR